MCEIEDSEVVSVSVSCTWSSCYSSTGFLCSWCRGASTPSSAPAHPKTIDAGYHLETKMTQILYQPTGLSWAMS